MGWDGDISRMGKLADNLGKLAAVPSRVARPVAKAIHEDIEDSFDRGVDPYGEAWEELKQSTIDKGRSPPPLTDTWKMRKSCQVFPTSGGGIQITIDHPAQVHQTGGENPARNWSMAARPILPGRGFPEQWKNIIDDAIAEEINGTMGER
jgi:phage gpG-like protein